ncbi:MAG TPA: hypothetical protein VM238_18345 [Phycisphaerae bacterium]|nr:hypothetical protein [Phycisphaerae bacterium]
MPIRSKAQWRKLAVDRPDLLHKWQKEYPRSYSELPERIQRKKGPLALGRRRKRRR